MNEIFALLVGVLVAVLILVLMFFCGAFVLIVSLLRFMKTLHEKTGQES